MSAAGPRVEWLTIAGDPGAWRSVGLTVDADGLVPLDGTSLRIEAPGSGVDDGRLVGWALSGIEPCADVDGLPTEVVAAAPPRDVAHEIGAIGIDHVVVMTDDLERSSAAVAEATGCELRRVREVGTTRQGFHRIGRGGLIVEIVNRPDVPQGPAAFWGLVLVVDDLDRACDLLGPERIGAPKDAVQPGRRIATMRSSAGLGVPVALMTR